MAGGPHPDLTDRPHPPPAQPAQPARLARGRDAYPTIDEKAAALLHSLARNHALVDGNKRLALAALLAFYGVNGRRLTLTNDDAYELVMNVASGALEVVGDIAAILRATTSTQAIAPLGLQRTLPGLHHG